jgi:hypothetical protein
MKLFQLFEMGAAKLCDKCGKTMAANHYWYKGGWKCKSSNNEQKAGTTPPTAPVDPNAVVAPTSPTQSPAAVQPTQTAEQPPQPATAAAPVKMFQLEFIVDIIAEAMPILQKEIDKINKTAKKVGSQPVSIEVVDTILKDAKPKNRSILDVGKEPTIHPKQKFYTIKLHGDTPRIVGADGNTWEFVGVITPSQQGKALLKLTPQAGDTEGIRKLYSANPYYCDHCKKVRQRNETFIVHHGNDYKQVGRNCLKDFVGGADPNALLTFFAFFSDPAALQARLAAHTGGGGGGPGRYMEYFTPKEILIATLAVVDNRGTYVSSKSETGVSTASEVRDVLWGRTVGTDQTWSEKIHTRMEQPDIGKQADDIIAWFKSLPKTEVDANTFYQNIKVMVDENAVEGRQVGYIVGMYPAWRRANVPATPKGPTLVKEWPQAWGAGPKPITNEHAVVKFVRVVDGTYGSSQLILMMLDDGHGVSWRYSGQNKVQQGDDFNLTGQLEQDTYRTPATIKFVPDRKWLRSVAFA